ncbi:hypothetical protein CEY09_06725 [Achromobacter marplatensis]|jgi:hypothetical protein|uniref:Uncharacterized protein n=1 Tax=Achromobacter marplatensis TaxID=470868 RepID=A0ABX9GJ27_9BURK|nr:hypothetical protein CEY09_06725 [Achromobacter marplatensis]RBP22885.1 hypothetical protein DFP87_102629 [Achromobacter marplatensis]CAB3645594.1 hypothetical protein LMG26219_02363 [Achromobacter marplatensis]
MRVRGLEFRMRILGAAGPSPSVGLYGGAAFGYNQLATDMRRRAAFSDTGGVAVSGVSYPL